MLLNPVSLHSPKTIEEAVQLFDSLEDVKILAGGTFLLNSLKLLKRKGTKTTANIISLRKIDGLKGVSLQGNVLTIRAMTIINDLYESPVLVDNLAVLKTVCRNISTNPIRNMATVGGNLTCRYTWTELGAVMIALNAQMHFMGKNSVKTSISAEEFFKNGAKSDKIFSHLTVERDIDNRMSYQRVKKTMHVDVPLLALCIRAKIKNGLFLDPCVAINNGSNFAQRDYVLEKFLSNAPADLKVVMQSQDHLDPDIYDKRSDEYKSHMFRVCIKNALIEIIQKS